MNKYSPRHNLARRYRIGRLMNDSAPDSYTKIPNALLDHIADLSEAELRIMLVIARKTIGWQKECDLISLTQFEQLTGLSRPSVNATLKLLIERGAVEQTGTGKRGVKCYRLSERLVNSVNQLSRATSKLSEPVLVNSVNQTSPGLVNSVNTQKKLIKERERARPRKSISTFYTKGYRPTNASQVESQRQLWQP
jgi:phage replication O-like protein O